MLADADFALSGVLAILAVVVAARHPPHRPVAAYVGWMFVADTARLWLVRAYRDAPRPLHGMARLAFHVDVAIAFSWSAFFIAACLVVFVGRGARYAFLIWIALVAVACWFYPAISGRALERVYLVVDVVSTVVAWATIVYGIFLRRDLRPGLGPLVLILYAASDVATYLFAFLEGMLKNWPIVQLANMLLMVALVAAHVVWLARRPLPRPA